MSERPIFHRTEILAELRREYSWRKRLYPGWVKQGRIDARQAQRQMEILDQVIQEYARRDMESDLFKLRTAASVVAAEVCGIVAGREFQDRDEYTSRVAERIARAMKDGK